MIFLAPCFFPSLLASDTYTWTGNGGDSQWTNPANWENDGGVGAPDLPPEDADVVIEGFFSVILSAPTNYTVESVHLIDGATLTIAQGATLNTRKGNTGNEGFTVEGDGSSLIINGTLNLNDLDNNLDIGLFVEENTSAIIGSMGILHIPDYGGYDPDNPDDRYSAMRVDGSLTNNGLILITNPFDRGILVGNGGEITNEGTITVSGGVECISFRTGGSLTNNGATTLSGASVRIITGGDGWEFVNNGVLNGDGVIKSQYFVNGSGSILAPGTSPGVLTFSNSSHTVNLSGVTLQIEINGTTAGTEYDQIQATGSGSLILTGSTIVFSGSHIPVSGNFFTIFPGSNIIGTPGGSFVLNGVLLKKQTGNGTFEFDQALPVELTSFTAIPEGKTAHLRWATATETNNDYFSIEHSTDGRYFSEVGRVRGAGTSQEAHHYDFVHGLPGKGLNYYRLDQHDLDGAHEYSKVQAVVIKGDNSWTIRPALARDVLTVEWPEMPGGNSTVEAFDLAGRKVYGREAPAQSASLQVPVADWAPGLYWVLVKDRGEVSAQRFVKE